MPRRIGVLVVALLAMCDALVAGAEQPAPCSDPAYRAFDFWVGDWEVLDSDGTRVGTNRITIEEAGCVLVERWLSAKGSTGRSFSFFDPGRMVWRQIWISPGSHIELEGNLLGAYMMLEGHIRYLKDGTTYPLRGTWAPLPDGRVRQYFEESPRPGEWVSWFEGFYSRRAASVPDLDNTR